ncbi:MAG TPA: hypothetical protein VH592_11050 [Gemmataceae bacterium]|jgi:hypothetical protein
MLRFRCRGSVSITLVVALAIIPTAIAQDPPSALSRSLASPIPDSADRSYKIYSLDDFGSDPGLCEWIAQTIPDVIAAGTWKEPSVIRYYPPKNILVVCHTPAVQTQVDGFLKDVKKSLPKTTKATATAPKSRATGPEVVPTVFYKPELVKKVQSKRAPEPNSSYPVPTQPKAPKHLFHFIIRYEGEGIVDDNIVKAMKDYYRAGNQVNGPARTGRDLSAPPADSAAPVYGAPTPPASEKEDKKEDKNTEKDKHVPPYSPATR